MNLQHVGPLVEHRLQFGTAMNDARREAETL